MRRLIVFLRAAVMPLRLVAALTLAVSPGLCPPPTLGASSDGSTPIRSASGMATVPPTNVTGTWAAAPPPPNGFGIANLVTGTDGNLYGVGSFNTSGVYQPRLTAYNPTTNAWTLLAYLPSTPQHFATAAGKNGQIYVIGGYDGTAATTAVEAYNPVSNAWTSMAPMPTAREDLAAATGTDGRIYAVGGATTTSQSGTGLSVVEIYDPSSNTWTTAAAMPNSQYALAAATAPDGRIFAMGGYAHATDYAAVNWVEAYTPSTNSWAVASPLPAPLSFFSAALGPDGFIYAFGGQFVGYTPGALYAYNPSTDVWGFAPSLPQSETSDSMAVTLDGRIITVGATVTTPPSTSTVLVEALTVTGTTTTGSPPCLTPTGAPLPAPGSWAPRAPLCQQGQNAATLGPGRNGGSLIYSVGGCGGWTSQSNCAQAYDPSSDTWQVLPSLPTALPSFVAATGSDGRIYAFGSGLVQDVFASLSVAYDPRARVWTSVPAEPGAAAYYGAVAGPTGLVYVLGGVAYTAPPPFSYTFAAFNPQTSAWTALAPPLYLVYAPWTMAMGGDGRIYAFPGGGQVEVYDPATNTWSLAPVLHTFRTGAAATGGTDGRVYLLGGTEEIQGTLSSVEAYQPGATGWGLITPMPQPASYLVAATDGAGRIYAIGGQSSNPAAVEVYTPTTPTGPAPYALGSWQPLAPLPTARTNLAATTSSDGHVYTLGGQAPNSQGHCVPQGTAEVYTPTTDSWAGLPSMPTPRYNLAAAPGGDGRIYAIGGWTDCVPGSTPVSTVEAYTPSTNSWAAVASLPVSASVAWAWLQPDGTIYAITDYYPNGSSNALSFNPSTGAWTVLGPIAPPPFDGNLTYGPDGLLYDVGGLTGSPTTYDVTTYSATTNTWNPAASLLLAQSGPGAITGIGPGGASDVFAIGGFYGSKYPQTAYAVEVLNPASNAWVEAASVPYARYSFAVTTLNGHVVILGGSSPYTATGNSADVEEYVPASPQAPPPIGTPTPVLRIHQYLPVVRQGGRL